MKHVSSSLFAGLLSVMACAPVGVGRVDAPAPRPPDARTRAVVATPASPSLAVSLALSEGTPTTIAVSVRGDGAPADLRTWSTALAWSGHALEVEDAHGLVPHALTEDIGTMLVLTREPTPPVTLRYSLSQHRHLDVGRDILAEAHALLVPGETSVFVPVALRDAVVPVSVSIEPCGSEQPRAASSFAATSVFTGPLHPLELAWASFACGDLDIATFITELGHDEVISIPEASYDMRWASAEIAILRTEVDRYFLANTSLPFIAFLRTPAAHERALPRAVLRSRSVLVDAPLTQSWSTPVRIAVTDALVRRWLDGRFVLRVPEGPAARGAWWSQGFVRFVALEVLVELGLLGATEYAEQVNAAELTLASARAIMLEDSEQAAAAGFLHAFSVDHELRVAGRTSLQQLLLDVLDRAQDRDMRVVTPENWGQALHEGLGHVRAPAFTAALAKSQRPSVASDVLEPCFRLRNTRIRIHDIGLADPRVAGRELGPIERLDPNGPAAAAGLHEGDVLVRLDYVPDDPTQPVLVEARRGDERLDFSFQARSHDLRVWQWTRSPRSTPQVCS